MRSAAPIAIVLLMGCSFDWEAFDPRLAVTNGGAAAGGSAGAAGAPGGSGGAGGGTAGGAGGQACGAGTQLCDGECVDFQSDALHCGDCTTQCLTGELCISGACQGPASCKELHQAQPGLADGSYTLDPGGGVSPFAAHCDMTIEGGGWTLVASVVDNSYFAGTRCHTYCDPDAATTCDESPFTTSDVVGDVAGMLLTDHKSAAYGSVPFDEMLFVGSDDHYVSYDISGSSVLAWYPAGLENYVPGGTEAHDTFSYSAPTGTCHSSAKGPGWSTMNNQVCFWDDAGVPWTRGAFFPGNANAYRLWLVR